MKLYEDKGFEVRQEFIPRFFAQYLRNYFDLLNRNDQVPNKGDAQVAKSVGIYGDPAFDTLMYSIGQTDEVKGTGVWSGFKLKREPKEKEDGDEKKDGDGN